MSKSKSDLLKSFSTVEGPEVKFGKHSTYQKIGKNRVIVRTKASDEEVPSEVILMKNTRRIIFQDSKDTLKVSYDTY